MKTREQILLRIEVLQDMLNAANMTGDKNHTALACSTTIESLKWVLGDDK